MLVCYHEKIDLEGWTPVKTLEHDSESWGSMDRWAIDHLMTHGSIVLTLGSSMWEVRG